MSKVVWITVNVDPRVALLEFDVLPGDLVTQIIQYEAYLRSTNNEPPDQQLLCMQAKDRNTAIYIKPRYPILYDAKLFTARIAHMISGLCYDIRWGSRT